MSLLVAPSAPGAPSGQSGMGAGTSAGDEIDSEKTSATRKMVFMVYCQRSLRKFAAYSTKNPALPRALNSLSKSLTSASVFSIIFIRKRPTTHENYPCFPLVCFADPPRPDWGGYRLNFGPLPGNRNDFYQRHDHQCRQYELRRHRHRGRQLHGGGGRSAPISQL